MTEVSIITPCYNVSEFIESTYDSIRKQTFSDWEWICVDDCSDDRTWELLQQIAQSDTRVRVYRLEKNSGSAVVPRDTAASYSSSPFVCNVDADDVIEPEYIERLMARQTTTKADVVLSRMCFFLNTFGDGPSIPDKEFDFKTIMTGREAVNQTLGDWRIAANGALVRKDVWKKRSRYLDKTFNHMNADEYGTREILVMSRKVAFADVAYHYRKHAGSITQDSNRSAESLITDAEIVCLFSREYGKQSSEYKRALSVYMGAFIGYCRQKHVDSAYLYKHFSHIKSQGVFASSFTLLRKCTFLLPFRLFRMCLR